MHTKEDRRFIQIGLKIAYYRKLNGLTQEKLAEMVGLSPGYIAQIEAPSLVTPVSLSALFAIADALQVPPYKFLVFDEDII